MRTTRKDILRAAQADGYAAPAFDGVVGRMVRTILETGEAWRAPVMLLGPPGPIRCLAIGSVRSASDSLKR